MSGEREKRVDEEQLLEGSAAWVRSSAALRPGENGPAGDSFPLRHLEATGLWWEGNQQGKYH